MTATLSPTADLRDCRLYRFWVEHPITGEEVLGYVGETVRRPFARMMEHVDVQPWIDTVTRWERDPRVFAGKGAVLEAEVQAIRAEMPLYNVRENLDNPHRIPPPTAIRQRRARDTARKRERWVHPDDRATGGARGSTPIAPVRRVPMTRSWSPVWTKVGVWCLAWVETGVATLGGYRRYGVHTGLRTELVSAAIISAALLAWALWRTPDTWRLWRRRLRRILR